MLVIPGILALVVFIYIRPQEWVAAFKGIPFIYILLGLAFFGFVVDVRLAFTRLKATPQLPYVVVFFVWALITMVIHAPASTYMGSVVPFFVSIVMYLLMAHGTHTFKSFQVLATGVLCAALFIAGIGVHQGFAPFGCAKMADGANKEQVFPDGRGCEIEEDCYTDDSEPGAYYVCEHIGLLGTTSVGKGRVRYRGVLQDPNELALTLGAALPFAFALRERKPIFSRTWFLILCLIVLGTCTILTKSRGGQLVFLAALGAYFVKKQGFLRGALAGAVMAAPLLLLGGRSDKASDSSSEERIEVMSVGIDLIRAYPITGAGFDQFLEHHFLTAHNSYLLAISELGLFGLILFTCILYLSVKIPLTAVLRYETVPGAEAAKAWSMALLASYSGLVIGIFFLSFTYHQVLWIFFGLSGALYSAIRRHDKTFDVKIGWFDFLAIVAMDIAFVVILYLFVRVRGG